MQLKFYSGPTGKMYKAAITDVGNSTYQVEFVPDTVGDHTIDVKIADLQANGSPFTCRVYDSRKIKVGNIPNGILGKAVHFVVDASEAGVGNLEVAVNEGRIPSMAQSLGQHRYDISFVPREEKDHTIGVKFNNESVPGSPFVCSIVSSTQVVATGPGLERIPAGRSTEFFVDPQGAPQSALEVNIRDPTGKALEANVTEDPSGGYAIEYVPEIVGNHTIDVLYANSAIAGSPFTSKVYDATKVKLHSVEGNVLGKPASFIIDAAKAGAGNMEIIVSVDGRNVPNFVQPEGGARFRVSFTPQEPKLHVISVKFNGEAVPGSPMDCVIVDSSRCVASGEGLRQCVISKPTFFTIDPRGAANAECNVVVTAPDGGAVPVKCFRQKDGNFRVEYTPTTIGEHSIDVTFADAPIEGSPFACEAVDCRKVSLGEVKNCLVNQESAITVNRKEAGKGDLKVVLLDPKGEPVPTKLVELSSGDEEVRFAPTKIGKHELQISFAGFEVPHSPVYFVVDEPGKPTAYGDGLQRAMANEPAIFMVESKKPKGDVKVEINGPNSKIKPTIEKQENHWKVSYVPTEKGKHEIRVVWNGKELSGSPFYPIVSDASKISLSGQTDLDQKGRLRLRVGQEKVLTVETGEAGQGHLTAEVRGPAGKLRVFLEEINLATYRLSFTPEVDGDHFIYLYWSDYPVPGTPSHAWAEPGDERTTASAPTTASGADTGRIQLRGDGYREARLGSQAEFLIDATRAASGRPTCTLTGQKSDIPVSLSPVEENLWRATYTPLVPGKYSLHVAWNDQHVKGSPFKVLVEAEGDASKVVVTGEGLKLGVIGKDIKSFIDTRRAGPGTLTAHCSGPTTRAQCDIYDHRDGTFTLNVKPEETGKHSLTIKYGAEHVSGSPFNLYVSNPPDASKVRVYGPGIEHGILSKFKSNFIVETKGAGAGQLTVRMRGPKGAFNVVMHRETKHDRTIHCKYDPRETGDYQIEVKWAGEHVPGSPFSVIIVDTQMELERILSGQPPEMMSHPLFLPPGWVGPPPPGILLPPPMTGPPMPMHALPQPPMPSHASPVPRSRDGRIPYATNTIYTNGSAKHWIAASGAEY